MGPHIKAKIYALVITLLLGACSHQPQGPASTLEPSSRAVAVEQQQARQALLAPYHQWRLRGKIGLRSPAQNGSAVLDWRQNGERFHLHISGPLGQGSTTISGDQDNLKLHGANASNNPQAQVEQTLGWPLPQRELPYWIRGLAAPHGDQQSLWTDGLLQSLRQGGWQIDYLRYGKQATPLPEKIKLQRGDLYLTLIVKRWQ